MFTILKKISFDAAHFLPGYPGKCQNVHGHFWTIELAVTGIKHEDGIVVDFKALKDFLDLIYEDFDHTLLNDKIPVPTAENIAEYIWGRYYKGAAELQRVMLAYIRVWETPDSMVELR